MRGRQPYRLRREVTSTRRRTNNGDQQVCCARYCKGHRRGDVHSHIIGSKRPAQVMLAGARGALPRPRRDRCASGWHARAGRSGVDLGSAQLGHGRSPTPLTRLACRRDWRRVEHLDRRKLEQLQRVLDRASKPLTDVGASRLRRGLPHVIQMCTTFARYSGWSTLPRSRGCPLPQWATLWITWLPGPQAVATRASPRGASKCDTSMSLGDVRDGPPTSRAHSR